MIKKSLNSDIFGIKRSNDKDFGIRALEATSAKKKGYTQTHPVLPVRPAVQAHRT